MNIKVTTYLRRSILQLTVDITEDAALNDKLMWVMHFALKLTALILQHHNEH
jgi:hypothetical protein